MYVYGISYGDIISACMKDNNFFFDGVTKREGHSTYRIFVNSYTKEITEDLKEFERVGCGYEGDGKRLFAIDVPPNVDVIKVRSLLLDGEKKGKWEWEIGYVTDKVGQ